MSQETSEWLNRYCLIGMTDKRGHAWHYRKSDQGGEPNHYPGAIPIEDVKRRLFDWRPVEVVPALSFVNDQEYDEVTSETTRSAMVLMDTENKAIVDPRTGKVFQYAPANYQLHYYDEWLLDNIGDLIDDSDLIIASAGLLDGGGVAWVQIELPENMVVSSCGFEYRPYLAATSSYNRKYATTFKIGAGAVVCDNTHAAFFDSDEAEVRIKHTVHSMNRINEARDLLGLTFKETGEKFAEWIEELNSEAVDRKRWGDFLFQYVPVSPEDTDLVKANANRLREKLDDMYVNDERCSPWNGTALGVLQTTNTYHQHVQRFKGASRAERNAKSTLSGEFAKNDSHALKVLSRV